MALSTRTIKGKIRSVGNIKKITKAMEMVAASKMRKSVDRALAGRVYAEAALNLLTSLVKERNLDHPLLHAGEGNKLIFVIVTSNKGLCGGYNVSIQKKVRDYMRDENISPENIGVIAVGKYAERFAKRLGVKIVATFHEILENPSSEDVRPIASILSEEFSKGECSKAILFYTRFVSALSQKSVSRTILPVKESVVGRFIEQAGDIEKKFEKENMSLYLFEPSEERLLEEVIPRLLSTMLYEGALESVASEHSSRMMAMRNATGNAGTLVDELTLSYNRARQATVTREIAEISAGADALIKN